MMISFIRTEIGTPDRNRTDIVHQSNAYHGYKPCALPIKLQEHFNQLTITISDEREMSTTN